MSSFSFPSGTFNFHNPVVNVSILSSCSEAVILEVKLLTGYNTEDHYLSVTLRASLEVDDDLECPTLPVWERLPFAEGVSNGISPKPCTKVQTLINTAGTALHCWSPRESKSGSHAKCGSPVHRLQRTRTEQRHAQGSEQAAPRHAVVTRLLVLLWMHSLRSLGVHCLHLAATSTHLHISAVKWELFHTPFHADC